MSMSPEKFGRFNRVLYLLYAVISLMLWAYLALFVITNESNTLLRVMIILTCFHLLAGVAVAAGKLIDD